ncbi:META domain-containing protein [Halomonas sp. PAMB 3232]|uniref:META domain-containing protein n=1 Tax=Halomonas sp. PAMB 3232 TaxID=3075221 RepID=UPI0028A0B126|nr:META domain-containing protein [Halomonas sp. PAMB 3232]WNL39469.1 META domain-containing protein [Halomonas sp. PAMB 3232]
MKKHVIGALAVSAALLLSACSSGPVQQGGSAPVASGGTLSGPLVGTRWNLLLMGTDERLSMPQTAFFQIGRDGRITGSDGCNNFQGSVSLGESQRIEVGELSTTRMGCAELDDARRVTGMLETAYRYLIDHDRVVFFGPDSRVLGGWRKAN